MANIKDNPETDDVPAAPADYAKNCGRVARLCVARAGERLYLFLDDALK